MFTTLPIISLEPYLSRMRLSGPAVEQTSELSPALNWTWWLAHMSLVIHYCKAPSKEVAGYDVVFLVVTDGSAFSKRFHL